MTDAAFAAPDAAFADRVRTSFAKQGLMAHLGVELIEVTPGRCLLRLPFRTEVSQQHGFFHGGAIATLADNSGGYAGQSLLAAGMEILTVEFKVNIIAPGRGEALFAEGHVVKNGRSLIIARCDIWAERSGVRTLCAIGQQTLMPLDGARVN
ncbi:MAG: thioesterase [Rhodospirillaceae bacterium BRH_c57]|nr:MAG: thioesterase [Rhodospirillaceae bacterium BRH_c57]